MSNFITVEKSWLDGEWTRHRVKLLTAKDENGESKVWWEGVLSCLQSTDAKPHFKVGDHFLQKFPRFGTWLATIVSMADGKFIINYPEDPADALEVTREELLRLMVTSGKLISKRGRVANASDILGSTQPTLAPLSPQQPTSRRRACKQTQKPAPNKKMKVLETQSNTTSPMPKRESVVMDVEDAPLSHQRLLARSPWEFIELDRPRRSLCGCKKIVGYWQRSDDQRKKQLDIPTTNQLIAESKEKSYKKWKSQLNYAASILGESDSVVREGMIHVENERTEMFRTILEREEKLDRQADKRRARKMAVV